MTRIIQDKVPIVFHRLIQGYSTGAGDTYIGYIVYEHIDIHRYIRKDTIITTKLHTLFEIYSRVKLTPFDAIINIKGKTSKVSIDLEITGLFYA